MGTTTYQFTGPRITRTISSTCPGCHKKVTRSGTFEKTVNPYNRNKVTGKPKTWDEVASDVQAEADAWQPDFWHQKCRVESTR